MQSGATCLQGLRSVCIHVATPLKKAKPQGSMRSIAVASSASKDLAKRKEKSNVQCAPDGWMFRQAQHDDFATKRERSEPHQADNLAKLRHEHLSMSELIAQILGAVSSEISLMWLSSVRGTRIDVATMTTFSRKTALLPQAESLFGGYL